MQGTVPGVEVDSLSAANISPTALVELGGIDVLSRYLDFHSHGGCGELGLAGKPSPGVTNKRGRFPSREMQECPKKNVSDRSLHLPASAGTVLRGPRRGFRLNTRKIAELMRGTSGQVERLERPPVGEDDGVIVCAGL